VFGFALIPLILTLVLFAWLAKNAPQRPKAKAMADYFKALGDRDSWWFMFFYSVTFGGFIGLASALPGYFNDQYGLSPVTAGYYTCVFGGSLMRRWAARWPTASAASAPCWRCTPWRRSASPPSVQPAQLLRRLALFVCTMLGLGAGNGAVFQLVPQRFSEDRRDDRT
jgi:NNP family nitrate/nitrite transporter-like MFS transporter